MIGRIYRTELRANRLLLLALPLLGLAVYGGIRYLQYAETSQPWDHRSILNDAFQSIALITLAALGLAVGIAHTARDIGQGRWAFLMHRPASPGTILLGKLASALTLYFVIALPPVAAILYWAATPERLPGPWEWGMASPILVDLCCGTTYILAGMLLVLRDARWFGSRLFPAAAAIACTGLSCGLPLWAAPLVIVAGWIILLPAAWSAISTRPVPSTQSRIGRFMTGVALVPASVAVPVLAAACLESCLKSGSPVPIFHQYVLSDGQVLDLSYPPGDKLARVVVTRNDELLTDARANPYKPAEERMQSVTLSVDASPWDYRAQSASYRAIAHYMVSDRAGRQDGQTISYYLFGRHYLVVYNIPIRGEPRIAQYIGRNGMFGAPAQVEPFAPDAHLGSGLGVFIIEPQRIYEAHQTQRHGPIFTAPEGETCRDASCLFSYGAKPEDTRTRYAVATDKALYLVDDTGRQLWRMPHPVASPTFTLAITPDPDVYMALYHRSFYQERFSGGSTPPVFVRFRADGTKLAQMDLPALYPPTQAPSSGRNLVPLVLIPPLVLMHDEVPSRGIAILVAQAILAVVLAIIVLGRARASRTALIGWGLVSLVGGVAGLVLMGACRQWPPRVECPSCHRKRLVTREHCEHCAAPFPVPDPGPVGIFDQVAEPAHPAHVG